MTGPTVGEDLEGELRWLLEVEDWAAPGYWDRLDGIRAELRAVEFGPVRRGSSVSALEAELLAPTSSLVPAGELRPGMVVRWPEFGPLGRPAGTGTVLRVAPSSWAGSDWTQRVVLRARRGLARVLRPAPRRGSRVRLTWDRASRPAVSLEDAAGRPALLRPAPGGSGLTLGVIMLTNQQQSAQLGGIRKAAVTRNGRTLAASLARAGLDITDELERVCSLICRHAGTLQRISEEECNGPDWMDGSDRHIGALWGAYKAAGGVFPAPDPMPEELAPLYERARAAVERHADRMARWGAEREARETLLEDRLAFLVSQLPAPAAGPWGAQLGGDPRGCVAIITCPAGLEELADDWGRRGICVPYNRSAS